MQETQETHVWSLGQEDPLEKEMETCLSLLAWEISWTEEPGDLQSMGSQRVGHDWAARAYSAFQDRLSRKSVKARRKLLMQTWWIHILKFLKDLFLPWNAMPNFPTTVNNFWLSSALQGKYASTRTEALWRPKRAIYHLLIQEVNRGCNQSLPFGTLPDIRIHSLKRLHCRWLFFKQSWDRILYGNKSKCKKDGEWL